jgi:hypothetical protein
MHEQSEQTNITPSLNGWEQQQRRNRAELVLHHDSAIAATQILTALAGDKPLPADVFQTLADKNRALADSPADEIHDSLTMQAVLLEALFLSFAGRAATAKRPDHAAALVKASLNCQKALNAVLATVHTLAETKRDRAAIEVEE